MNNCENRETLVEWWVSEQLKKWDKTDHSGLKKEWIEKLGFV